MPAPITHILLIEDNPGDARLIQEYLNDAGAKAYHLYHGQTLAEGREILKKEKVDIILLDLHLPDSVGFPTFQRMQNEFPFYPIIVLTGLKESDFSLGLRALKNGAQDYLSKNELDGRLLSRVIRYAIERKQLLSRLEQAQQLAKVGNWMLNLSNNEMTWSPQVYAIFEKEKGKEIEGFEEFMDMIHPEDQQAVALKFMEAFEQGGAFRADHRIKFNDGRVKHITLKGNTEVDRDGNLVAIIGTTQDITERWEIEALRREKELATKTARLREVFLAKTSHEIRTPLSPILVLTSILLDSPLNEEQRDHLNAIKAAGDTLMAVVNDILDFSKIEAGKIEFHKDNFSIGEVFASIENMMLMNAQNKEVKLQMKLDPSLPSLVIGDSLRLTQILLNLVVNAIKFTQEGYIHVTAKNLGTDSGKVTVRFTVEDTGIGIPQDKLKMIFESFHQLENEANRRYGGTGLGLTIVKQLVILQGGKISVESQENEGSSFTFELPFELAKTPGDTDTLFKIDKDRLSGAKILLAEDNPLNQMVTNKLLSDWGVILDIANNGREAITKLAEKNYDLVLMDVQMPEMDGFEATHYIREKMEPPTRNIPIIALTANAFSGSDNECIRVGMNDYVSKPIQIKNLYLKLVEYIQPRPESEKIKPENKQDTFDPVPVNGNLSQAPVLANEPKINESMDNPQFTNLTYLKEISGGDSVIIKKTIGKFLETTPDILHKMDQHLEHQEYSALGKCAHKLKSSIAFMGIDEIKDTILSIEKASKDLDQADKLPKLVARTRNVIEQSYDELKGSLATL